MVRIDRDACLPAIVSRLVLASRDNHDDDVDAFSGKAAFKVFKQKSLTTTL